MKDKQKKAWAVQTLRRVAVRWRHHKVKANVQTWKTHLAVSVANALQERQQAECILKRVAGRWILRGVKVVVEQWSDNRMESKRVKCAEEFAILQGIAESCAKERTALIAQREYVEKKLYEHGIVLDASEVVLMRQIGRRTM